MIHAEKSALKIAPPVVLPHSLNNQAVNNAGMASKTEANRTRSPNIKDKKAMGRNLGKKYSATGIAIFCHDPDERRCWRLRSHASSKKVKGR